MELPKLEKLKELFYKIFGIDKEIEKLVNEHAIAILEANAKIKELENQKSEKEKKIAELERLVDDRNSVIDGRNGRTAEIDRKIADLEEQVAGGDSRIKLLGSAVEKLNSDIVQANSIITEKDSAISSANARIAELKVVVKQKDSIISEHNAKITELNGLLEEKDRVIAERNNTIEHCNSVIASHEKCKSEYEEAIAPFIEINCLLCKCASMKGLAEELEIPCHSDLSISDAILMANIFSYDIYFAGKIYEHLKNYKRDHPGSLSEDELALIARVNTYYKDVFVNHDILDCSILERLKKGERVRFDMKAMRISNDLQNFDVAYVDDLFVPMLRDMSGTMAQYAIVTEAK